MKSLFRTRVAGFMSDEAIKLDELEARLKSGDNSFIHSVDSVFTQYEKASVLETADKFVRNGNRIPQELICDMQDSFKKILRFKGRMKAIIFSLIIFLQRGNSNFMLIGL